MHATIRMEKYPNKRVESDSLRRRFAPPPLAAHARHSCAIFNRYSALLFIGCRCNLVGVSHSTDKSIYSFHCPYLSSSGSYGRLELETGRLCKSHAMDRRKRLRGFISSEPFLSVLRYDQGTSFLGFVP